MPVDKRHPCYTGKMRSESASESAPPAPPDLSKLIG
jgi:hypothetical protein